MTRALVALCMLAIVGGCAAVPKSWTRPDGKPVNPAQLELDQTACRGEADKANLPAGREAALLPDQLGWSEGMLNVYRGCMAQRGYLQAPER